MTPAMAIGRSASAMTSMSEESSRVLAVERPQLLSPCAPF
jgi:hypothetical protein